MSRIGALDGTTNEARIPAAAALPLPVTKAMHAMSRRMGHCWVLDLEDWCAILGTWWHTVWNLESEFLHGGPDEGSYPAGGPPTFPVTRHPSAAIKYHEVVAILTAAAPHYTATSSM